MKILDIPAHPFWDGPGVKWSLDGRAITYHLDHKNIWSQSLDGGPPTQLTRFDKDEVVSFAWSRTGDLAISHGIETGDIVMFTGFK